MTTQLKTSLGRHFYVQPLGARSTNGLPSAHLGPWRDYFSKIRLRSILLFFAGYYLSVRFGERAYGSLGMSSPFWLPGAFLLSSFLLTQKKYWPLIAVAVFPIRLAAGAPLGTPLWFLLFSSADDLVTTVFAAWLLVRVLRRPVRLATLNEFLLFLAIGAGIGPALAALIAAPGRLALGDAVVSAAYHWYLGNALGQAIVTPTLLYWYFARRARSYPPFKELLVLSGGLTAVSLYTFVFGSGPYSPILSYAPVPFIVWAALRLRPVGTATAVSLLASVAMLSAAEGVGLFSKGSPSQNVLSLQLFLLVVSIPLLCLSIIIDERQGAHETVRESEERFRLVANTAPVMIWMSGPDKLCIYFNQPWLEFSGQPLEAELGNGWSERVHPEDLTDCLDTYTRAFDLRQSFRTEYRLRRHDGEYRWVVDIGVPRVSPEGLFVGFIGSCIDVTESKLAEEVVSGMGRRLIEAHEEERTWIARELHDDINQRIALMTVQLKLWAQHPPSSEANVRKHIGSVCEQLTDLGSEVQALSHRLHSSKLEYLGIGVAAGSFCKELSEQQQVEIEFSQEGIPHSLPKEIALCLFRVLQEALQNAVKHSGERHFRVELHGTASEIQLTVSDSGIGFDQQATADLSGIGLISMRERLKLVGGELSIQSEPGHGATINACVPFRAEAYRAHAAG